MRSRLRSALERFGTSLLTKRACQVINRILLRYSSKTISAKFPISAETVKLHRKQAYAKLNCKTQAELFQLFLESLVSER